MESQISVLITTKNRLPHLEITLNTLKIFMQKGGKVIICDDGSIDGTWEFLKINYPEIKTIKNQKSRGLIDSRNRLMNHVQTEYAISLDDDANFLSDNPYLKIVKHFENNPNTAVIAFRIFWGKSEPENLITFENSERVKGFVGCGHVWRMKAWFDIPNYPEWFKFYGEEEFASYHLFKKNWEILYLPQILVHHRVIVKERKFESDYLLRLRYALRAGWYLYFMFTPIKMIPNKMVYSIWMQLKLKVFRGEINALKALMLALKDLLFNFNKVINHTNRLSQDEYKRYSILTDTKIYWNQYD